MWVPPEATDPILLHAPTRKSVGFFGAVCERDGRMSTQPAQTFNADTFESFLKKLLRRHRPGYRMVVIVDNARWHHAKKLNPWLNKHRDHLILDYLPPYSPELNHIERVWKLTRRLCTHNRYFPQLEELLQRVENQFALWKYPNSTLHKLCAIT